MASFTRFVILDSGKVFQINRVTGITIVSPTVTDGFYRDSPPVIVGGAAAGAISSTSTDSVNAAVAGGVSPVSSATSSGTGWIASASGASSVLQDDAFTHTALRDKAFKLAFLKFTTDDALSDYDCIFKLSEVVGVFNAAPPGFAITESR